jgi:hypothetical protein
MKSYRMTMALVTSLSLIGTSMGCAVSSPAEGYGEETGFEESSESAESVTEALRQAPTDDDAVESGGGSRQPPAEPTASAALAGCTAQWLDWSQWQPAWAGNANTEGEYTCFGFVPARSSGLSASTSMADTSRVGAAQFTCNNGSWSPPSPSATCNGKVVSTTTISGSTTCVSGDPVRTKWIGWYLADLFRCPDTAGLDFWVGVYNDPNNSNSPNNCGPGNPYGSKDACFRNSLREAAEANDNSYSVAQALGHIAPSDEISTCGQDAYYPWASIQTNGTKCKYGP